VPRPVCRWAYTCLPLGVHFWGTMARLTLRIPDSLLDTLKKEAEASGFASVSDYARRKLAVATALERIADTLERQQQSLSLILEHAARAESRLEERAPSAIASAPSPSRLQVFSPQHGRMVDLDADGREIPPE
jgi:hypothetical protein